LHNVLGAVLAGLLYGPEGARYAAHHILLDRLVERGR